MQLLRRSRIKLLIAGAVLYASIGFAHHSYLGVYDPKDQVSVTGTVTQVRWMNPHAAFHLDAKNPDGTVEAWVFELHSPNTLMRAGWTRDSVKPGDVVTVKGARARARTHQAFVDVVIFPDGREVFRVKFGSED